MGGVFAALHRNRHQSRRVHLPSGLNVAVLSWHMLAAGAFSVLSPERRLGSRIPAIPHILRAFSSRFFLAPVMAEMRHCPGPLVKPSKPLPWKRLGLPRMLALGVHEED